jgi:hypothetical protein
MSRGISRRTVLRGLGATIALPLLDAMAAQAGAAQAGAAAAAGAAGAAAPTRMALVFLPNGMWMPSFTPRATGTGFDLPETLQPLAAVKDQLTVLSGLALDNARAKGDGPGDHARSAAAFLTGAHPFKTAGSNIRVGVSMDQVAAERIGNQTRLPSLELGLDRTAPAGNCDSGYACAYVSNISWRSERTPMPKMIDPAMVFDRLFGSGDGQGQAKRLEQRRSILDFVAEDARALQRSLGRQDQHKLDEFATSIRDVEKRVQRAQTEPPVEQPADLARPDGIPRDFAEHMRLMMDMLVLAFQMDLTRVSTFMVARDGSDRRYSWLGINEGHHTVSHHGRDSQKVEAIRRIDRFHMEQVAYLLGRMASVREGSGTLLDNSMVLVGSGIADGDRHNHDDLPILLAGGAGGAIQPGRHLQYPRNTPLCNLYLSMLDTVGAPVERFGDSSGPLKGLA